VVNVDCRESKVEAGQSRMMKEELLDIETILSQVAACLTVTHLATELLWPG
jgi:hypothetical protein